MSTFYIFHQIIVGWITSFIFQSSTALIYHLEWDCFERYKVLEDPWPWKQLDPDEWWIYLQKTLRTYLINIVLMAPLSLCIYLVIDVETAMDCTPDGLPSRYQLVLQLFVCMIFEDLGFHVFHRILHMR